MIVVGVVLIGIGGTMLVMKLTGGLSEGFTKHLTWGLIPIFIVIGGSCIGQAIEWRNKSGR